MHCVLYNFMLKFNVFRFKIGHNNENNKHVTDSCVRDVKDSLALFFSEIYVD